MDKEKYQGKIEALGGSVVNTVSKEVIALISDKGKGLWTLPMDYSLCHSEHQSYIDLSIRKGPILTYF